MKLPITNDQLPIRALFAGLLLGVFFAGCTPLDRKNPTDPKAGGYYQGMHYEGSIGDSLQGSLSDFTVNGSEVLALDRDAGVMFSYSSGQTNYYTPSMFTQPTGIAADSNYIYVVDNDPVKNLKVLQKTGNNITVLPVSTYISSYTPVKCAVAASYIFVTSSNIVYRYNLPNLDGEFTWNGAEIGTASFSQISDIKVNPNGDVVVADSAAKMISVFNVSGNRVGIGKIIVNYNIQGIGLSATSIYVPSDDGIHTINYATGSETAPVFGGYGDGAGKVTHPSTCGVSGQTVLIGDGAQIKEFGP